MSWSVSAGTVSNANGVVCVPAFTGLGAPIWDPYARGAFAGMTCGTNWSALRVGHIGEHRATEQSIRSRRWKRMEAGIAQELRVWTEVLGGQLLIP